MKIKYILPILFILSPLSAFADTLSVSPSTVTSTSDSFTVNYSCTSNQDIVGFNPSGIALTGAECTGGDPATSFTTTLSAFGNWIPVPFVPGTYTFLAIEPDDSCIVSNYDGVSDDLSNCLALHPTPVATLTFTVPPSTSAFMAQLASATSTFSATTGFDIDGVINWAGDNLIKLFIGSMIAILYSIRGWLVAMVIIGAIIYFAYRAFRFFRH